MNCFLALGILSVLLKPVHKKPHIGHPCQACSLVIACHGGAMKTSRDVNLFTWHLLKLPAIPPNLLLGLFTPCMVFLIVSQSILVWVSVLKPSANSRTGLDPGLFHPGGWFLEAGLQPQAFQVQPNCPSWLLPLSWTQPCVFHSAGVKQARACQFIFTKLP